MDKPNETTGSTPSVKFGGFALKTKAANKLQPVSKSAAAALKAKEVDADETKYTDHAVTRVSHGDSHVKQKKELVIPMIKENIYKTSDGQDDDMALAASSLIEDARNKQKDDGDSGSQMVVPLLQRNAVPTKNQGNDEISSKQNYLDDVAMRPEVSSLDEYENVPVSEFGAALLRGMGWKDGTAVGSTKSGLIEPIEYVPRFGRSGLGASISTDLPDEKSNSRKKYIKPGEKRGEKKHMVAPSDADGKVKHYRKVGEALVEKDKPLKFEVNARVRIERGSHAGLYGTVTELGGISGVSETCGVRLSVSGQIVRVPVRRTCLVKESEYMRYRHKIEDGDNDDHSGSVRDRGNKRSYSDEREIADRGEKKSRGKERYSEVSHSLTNSSAHSTIKDKNDSKTCDGSGNGSYHSRSREERTWLRSGIVVRVISRRYGKGKYYTSKVTVSDVVGLHMCECRSGSGRLLTGLTDDMLETVIPKKAMALVMVVRGEYAGELGQLVERDTRMSTGTVQLLRERTVHTFDYEDISEYSGTSDVHDIE
eukprot:CFRG6424T1